MDEIDIRQAEMLKTLAHPLRLGIVHQLAVGPAGVASIATHLGISQPNASQHLAVMRASGVVIAERNGREVCYRLFDPEIVTACESCTASSSGGSITSPHSRSIAHPAGRRRRSRHPNQQGRHHGPTAQPDPVLGHR